MIREWSDRALLLVCVGSALMASAVVSFILEPEAKPCECECVDTRAGRGVDKAVRWLAEPKERTP